MRALSIMEATLITAEASREETKRKPKTDLVRPSMTPDQTNVTRLYTTQASLIQGRNSEQAVMKTKEGTVSNKKQQDPRQLLSILMLAREA